MGDEPLEQRQQKIQEIQKTMPFKNHGRGALGPKAAKSSRNPKIDAFQDSWDRSPRTKGSKKPEKSPKRCLSRNMGQEPNDERQQKPKKSKILMPFKILGTRARGPKAAKKPRNQKIDAFQDSWDKSPWTKGSNDPRNQKKCCFCRLWRDLR